LDARPELRRDLALDVVAQEPVNFLDKRGELLLEQERGVLGVHLSHARDADGLAPVLARAVTRGRRPQAAVEPLEYPDAGAASPRAPEPAPRRLERPLQQMQQRERVREPVRQLRVVVRRHLHGRGHVAHDPVEQSGALELEHAPVQQRPERDARENRRPAAEGHSIRAKVRVEFIGVSRS
jgi:hypothetical protein